MFPDHCRIGIVIVGKTMFDLSQRFRQNLVSNRIELTEGNFSCSADGAPLYESDSHNGLFCIY